MSTVAPPLAGVAGVPLGRFLLVDGLGAVLYGALLLFLGYLFSNQIEQVASAMSGVGGSALSLMIGVAALYLAYKYWQRRSLLRELRMARITVAELRQKQEAGENPVILDLRSKAELERDPSVIQGAIHLVLDEVEQRRHEFPHDRDIVVYCSCPNEATAAKVALLLQRHGFTRVRPLLGGIDAWREGNHPMEMRTQITTNAPRKQFLLRIAPILIGSLTGCGKHASQTARRRRIRVLPVEREAVEGEYIGRRKHRRPEIRRASALFDMVHFKEGKEVKKGDLLFTTDLDRIWSRSCGRGV
jgi:rhodanese-related sulfurtransferase